MMNHKNHYTNGRAYSLSPVATVEYIRTQMREGSPRPPTFAKNAKNSEEKATDQQSSQTDPGLKVHTSDHRLHGKLRCNSNTPGDRSNSVQNNYVRYNNIYSGCRNSRDQDKKKSKDMKFEEHQLFSKFERRASVSGSPNTYSETCSAASPTNASLVKLQVSDHSDSDSTFDSYRYRMARTLDDRARSNQHSYIQQCLHSGISPGYKNTSEEFQEQHRLAFRYQPFLKTHFKHDEEVETDARQVTSMLYENVSANCDKDLLRIRNFGVAGSDTSMKSGIRTGGSGNHSPETARTSSPPRQFSKSVADVQDDVSHAAGAVVDTPLVQGSSTSQFQIRDRRHSPSGNIADTDNRRAALTLGVLNSARLVPSNDITSGSLVNVSTDKTRHVTENEPRHADNDQNDYCDVQKLKLTCSNRNLTNEVIKTTQTSDLHMSPKMGRELTECSGIRRRDNSMGTTPQTAPDSGSNCGFKPGRKTLHGFSELTALIEDKKGHAGHHSDNLGLDSTNCQQPGVNYFNSIPAEISTCNINCKEMISVLRSRRSMQSDSNNSCGLKQHGHDVKDNKITASFTADTVMEPTPGVNDAAVIGHEAATKRGDKFTVCSVNTLKDFKSMKERMKARRFTDLSSSLFKYRDQVPGHGSKKCQQTLSEEGPKYSIHDSSTLFQKQLPRQLSRKATPNRRYSLGVTCAKSAEIAAIYSRLQSPIPFQGQPSRQTAATDSLNRRYSHGVMRAKSAKITAIYSGHDYPPCPVNLQPGGTDQQLQGNRKLPANTLGCSHLPAKEGSSQQLVNRLNELPSETAVTPCSSGEHKKGRADEMSETYYQKDNDKIMSQTEVQTVSHSQRSNFEDEEFRSADVFLAELEMSCHGSRSPGSGEVDNSRNIHILSTSNKHDNNDMVIHNSRFQQCASNCDAKTLPKFSVASAKKPRQSFPCSSSSTLVASSVPRRMTLELTFQGLAGHGRMVPVESDLIDDSVDTPSPARAPLRGANSRLVSWCKGSAEGGSIPTLYSCHVCPQNTCSNTPVEERETMEQNANSIEGSCGLPGNMEQNPNSIEGSCGLPGNMEQNANSIEGSCGLPGNMEQNPNSIEGSCGLPGNMEQTANSIEGSCGLPGSQVLVQKNSYESAVCNVEAQDVNTSYQNPMCIKLPGRQPTSKASHPSTLPVLSEVSSKNKHCPISERANTTCLEAHTIRGQEIIQETNEDLHSCLDLFGTEDMSQISTQRHALYNFQKPECGSQLEEGCLPNKPESSQAKDSPTRDMSSPLQASRQEVSQRLFDDHESFACDTPIFYSTGEFGESKASTVDAKEAGQERSEHAHRCCQEPNLGCAQEEPRHNGNSSRTNMQRFVDVNVHELQKTVGSSKESFVYEDNHSLAELNTSFCGGSLSDTRPASRVDVANNQHNVDITACLNVSTRTAAHAPASTSPQPTATNQATDSLTSTEPTNNFHISRQSSASEDHDTMERRKKPVARNRNVFKGAVLISLLVETNARLFSSRLTACKFARRLFREGHIQSISGAKDFEDSAQLYVWCDLERAAGEHGHLSSASSSYSNSKTDKKPNKQISWQFIQDIKSRLLNRSEAYNIVTSYNTFFQELEQDFGFVRNPSFSQKSPSGRRGGWSQSNTPFTSTLENKKDPVHSTDSSLDNQAYVGRFRGSKSRRNSKLPPCSSSKSNVVSDTSAAVPHEKSLRLNHPQQERRSLQQKHLQQQHLHEQQHLHQQHKARASHQNVPDVNKGQAGRMSTEHNLVSDERFISANQNSQLPQVSTSDPANVNHKEGSRQQSAMASNNKSSKTSDNLENVKVRISEPILNRDNDRKPTEQFNNQPQAFPLEAQNWLDPGISHFSGSQQWAPKSRPEDGSSHVNGSRPRWAESSVNDGMDNGRRWPESTYSYSDNEKQLLEEMRRMKKEHQNVLRTYESRINKLMARMHELRNIAEMLEHSSNKSSPYGILPGKLALLNILGGKAVDTKNAVADSTHSESDQVPPPLPPRPGKGSRVYPNKPIIRTNVTMKPLPWSRIILESNGGQVSHTVWHGMIEPKIDTEELQRLFSESCEVSEVNLYDDICVRRGRSQTQLVSIFDTERSQRIVSELQSLHCTLTDVTQAFMTLNCDGLHTDSFAELLELLKSQRELDQISHHTKKRGAGQLDAPEFLVSELSKIDHFRERLEFLRFKNKIQINLFEIDQQLRELQTACEEITSSVSLKHVLETVLAIGNHMNAGSDKGQADGFQLDVLTSLKDVQDMSKQNSLLELAMRTYCLRFESDLAFGCPTRFRLPEPSNMRHAAQVSFEDIQRALKELKDELSIVRNKLETLSKREGNALTITLRAISENFLSSAMEVLAEEQKLLDDTRVQFWKTASFFSFDGQKSTPHEFFQIWASFLHDCKYYWKLAHRNLAKAKFNTDLTTKSQLSCSSLPGFSSLRSAMMKHVAIFQQDEDMRTNKSQQLQHINSWIQSVGRYTLEMQAEGATSGPDVKDYLGQHQAVPQEPERKKLQPQLQVSQLGDSSSPYQNETTAEIRNSRAITNLGRQLEQENTPIQDTRAVQLNKTRHHDHDIPQRPSSPKPINATPPNVLKPQATIHPAFKQANSVNFTEFNPAMPMNSYQANAGSMKNPHRNSSNYPDDNFGFEPLYESLSHYSQNHLEMNEETNCPQDGVHDSASSGHTLSPDHDQIQKKNSNFFKSLLKRDQMRAPVHEEPPQVSPLRNMSAPFSKVKHTFAHKFSGSGNAKNSNSASPKNYISHQNNTGAEIASKPLPGAPLHHESYHTTGRPAANNIPVDVKDRDSADYQNLCFPDQPRPEALNHAETPDSLEVHPDHSERIFYREGHESLPSTISSLQSVRGRNRTVDQRNGFSKRDVAVRSHDAFHKGSKEQAGVSDTDISKLHIYNNDNRTEPSNQSSQARIRAPIALGSNMSISEAYTQGAEQAQISGNFDFQPPQSAFSQVNQQQQVSLISHDRNIPDTKWIKASPVPVYKARVIPNYENQSKYDPRFEGGVRGQAAGLNPPVHAPQVSISSDVYRQELQKKSEQYLGGGIYPTLGLTSGGSGSLRSNGSMGASYTILPPKPNHYQALPVTLSHSPLENSSHMYPPSSNLMPETSQAKISNQPYGLRNNPENGEAVSTSDYSPKGPRHNIEGTKPNSDRRFEVAKGQSLPLDAEKDRTAFVNNISAYRSSSAQSILDRDNEFRKEDRRFHSAYARPESQHYKTESHVSRKDLGGKKTTATSRRVQSPVRGDVPQSVTSLIDRFEKGVDVNNPGIGLLDISDKPPSMTSTPVVKRKNQGVTTSQPSHGQLVASKSDGESRNHRSQSEEIKQFHSQKEITNMPRWPNSRSLQNQPGTVHASLDRHVSNSHHQTVASHYMQPHCDDSRKPPNDQFQSNHVQHLPHSSKHQKPPSYKPQLQQSQHQQSQHPMPETPPQRCREQYQESDHASEQPQSQANISPGYDNIPQWHQQRHSPQVNPTANYQPQLSTVQPYNSFPTNSSINPASLGTPEKLRYNEDFYHSTKLANSAFEHPHRVAAKYGRQPGAMAVVKPTVMNI